MFVVNIEHRSPRRLGSTAFEQYLLGAKIRFHRMVIVEVVTGQVGECGNVKRNTIDSLLLKRVRGDCHYRFGCALAQCFGKDPIQF